MTSNDGKQKPAPETCPNGFAPDAMEKQIDALYHEVMWPKFLEWLNAPVS